MAMAFISALSGLRVNQSWIDIIGNNIANTNTTGFKSSRALFSDLLSVTQRPATPPVGNLGGTNPLQFGLGVQVGSVDRSMDQGALDSTGRIFDLALLGRGYFALDDGGSQTLYSRIGAFGLDASGNMVDLRSGFRVLDASGSTFQIDTSAVFPPAATTEVGYSGNLPAEIGGPRAEELSSSAAFNEGTAAAMTGTASGPFVIAPGETWTMELVVNGGAPQQIAIADPGVPLTAQDIVDEINLQAEDVTAAVAGNAIMLTSGRSGATSTIEVNAGTAGQDLKGLLGLGDFVQGTETIATAATDLNDLTINLSDYQSGDVIDVSGTDMDGTPVVGSFTYGVDGTTVSDLVAFVDAQYTQSTAAFNAATGEISVTSNTTGEADLSLALVDAPNQAGRADWASNFFAVSVVGTGPDTVTTSVEVFDSSGVSHILTGAYERQDDGTWTLDVSVPPSEGTVTSPPITGITFNENGSLQTPTTGQVTVQFGSLAAQTIDLDLGTSGQFDGLTQFGNPSSVVADFQDGFGAGDLANMEVQDDGSIEGFYTNGQSQTLGSFGVATFANEGALADVGDSFYRTTANTGNRILGSAGANGAGDMVGGALEASNVDTAQEFIHLIQAQRGFQANARVVTVQDELLAEVANIV